MRNDLFIGLDIGTSAAKAVAWTPGGTAVARSRASISVSSPSAGLAEQNAAQWWQASCRALRGCAKRIDARRVRAVGITVQRETFVFLDSAFLPLAPAVLWYDSRGTPYLAGLCRKLGKRAYHSATGKQLDVTSAIAKLKWFADRRPDVLAATHRIADVLAYTCHRLTGRLVTTYAGADTTGLVRLRRPGWHAPHLEAAGLSPAQLPDLVPPCTVVGEVGASAADATGLVPGTPVVPAGGDGHCFALGASAFGRGGASLTLGTSGVLGIASPRVVLGDEFRTLTGCDRRYLLESVIQCGSAMIEWFDADFNGGSKTWRQWERLCSGVAPGCDGLMVLPYWRGARTPYNDPAARGVVVGWTDRHTQAHMRRAIMEGIALEVRSLLNRIGAAHGIRPGEIVVGGGGAASDTWCSMIASALGVTCRRPATVELASLGAAVCAMAATHGPSVQSVVARFETESEVFPPDDDAGAVYGKMAPLYEELYARTSSIAHGLASLK